MILFSRDVETSARFYCDLGFAEVFRLPSQGPAIHVDLELDGCRLGLASVESARRDHGLDPAERGHRATVTLWTDDTTEAFRALVTTGVTGLASPHVWLGRLLIAWVADPDGHPIQLVQPLDRPGT